LDQNCSRHCSGTRQFVGVSSLAFQASLRGNIVHCSPLFWVGEHCRVGGLNKTRTALSLWRWGGALYAVSTLAPDPKFPPVKQEPAPEVASNAAEGGSSHAILPEQPAAQARAVDQPPAPDSQLPQKKLLKLRCVASLHIGPSPSAKVIGTAQADTEAEVVSRVRLGADHRSALRQERLD
jgi:hypothetical protein